jgi:cell division protease FtsH
VKGLLSSVRTLFRFRNPPEAPPPQVRRGWVYAGLGALVPLLIATWLWIGREEDRHEYVPYSEFAASLEQGLIEGLTVDKSGERVIGTLRTPRSAETGGAITTIKAVVPRDVLTLEDLDRWAATDTRVEVEVPGPYAFNSLHAITILLFGALIFVLLRTQGVLGRTRRYETTAAGRRLTLADVGGASEAQADLRDIVSFLKDPDRYSSVGAVCPKGILLVGPPGTGKTLLARAVAGESDRPVLIASGSEFSEMYVGVGARRVRDLARQARKQAPCIVFIDEFESIGRRRGQGNRSSEEENTLNQLLIEMDGMTASEGVVWMAATNREDLLDPAVRRPGRFDRVVEVGLPSASDRLQILRIHSARKPMGPEVNLERLAALTIGYSGAELANLLNEAAIGAAQDGEKMIRSKHIEAARDKVALGRLRSGVVISAHERQLVAIHEAGHVVVGMVACPDDRLHKVTIEARGRSLGAAHFAPDADRHLYSRRYLEGTIAKALGGRAAELVFFGEDAVTSGAGSDLIHATRIARRMVGEFGMSAEVGLISADPAVGTSPSAHLQGQVDGAIRTLIAAQAELAEEIVRAHRDVVLALALALLEHDVLDAPDVLTIAQENGLSVATPLEHLPLS